MAVVQQLKDSDGNAVEVLEGRSSVLTLTVTDPDETTLDPNNLTTLTLTLYDEDSETIINSRSAVDIKGANNATINGDNTVTVRLDPADAAIVGNLDTGQTEDHIALLTSTWNDGTTTLTSLDAYRFPVEKKASPS